MVRRNSSGASVPVPSRKMSKPTFQNSFTVGNVLTIIVLLIGGLATILQAVEHRKDTSVHQKASEVVRKDEFRELRIEMKEGFETMQLQEQRHFDALTERIDELYK